MNSLAKPDDDAPNGMDMRLINKLLAAGLQSGRTFVISNQQDQAQDTTDYELITWLVIKDDKA